MNAVATSDSTTPDSRTSCRRVNVAMMDDTNPGRRDEDDVDLGMAEEPEQVLVEQRVAAFGRVEEVRADQCDRSAASVLADHHRRHREDHHERRHQLRPAEQRNAVQRHARGAHLERR